MPVYPHAVKMAIEAVNKIASVLSIAVANVLLDPFE